MPTELAEKIRSNLLTQALVVVLCVSFSSSRRSQTADMAELEKLYVAHLLLTASAGQMRAHDTPGTVSLPQEEVDELERHVSPASSMSAADAIARFFDSDAKGSPIHRLPLPSGGWLRFRAERDSYKRLAAADGNAAPLYEFNFVTQPDSDLHLRTPLSVKITNAEEGLHPATGKEHWQAMPLRALTHLNAEPMRADDIESAIRRKAQAWTDSTGKVDDLYASVRHEYENEEISIPMVNTSVSASLALAALALLSTALSAHASFLFRHSAEQEEAGEHHGLLILRPDAGTVPPGLWHQLLAQAEVLFVQPPYWAGLSAPVICCLLLGIIHRDMDGWWLGWALLPFALAYAWRLGRRVIGSSTTREQARS
jgi:hypothetical protein